MSLFYANKFIASLAITALTVTSVLTPAVAMASGAQVKSTYNVQSTQSSINTLTRLGGYDRYGTAEQIADHGWQSASTAVLAPSGDQNMVDALTSSSLAKAVDGPILLADKDSVPVSTLTELKKLGVTKVYLVSGTAVMSAKVESQLTAAGIQSVRLGGYDRYETAVNIAKEIQKIKPFQEVVVTNAYANVDAISIAPIAAAKGIPVLLVDQDSVPKVVSDFIKASGINKTYVIGGTAVVSNSVKDALPNAMRLGGNDRFDTNTEVLKHFKNLIVGGSMFFANGSDTSLIDSLTGAPMAAKLGGAIVLSNKEAVPAGTKGFIQTDIALKNPGILGGTAVMSDSAVQSLGYVQPGQSAILNGAVELNTPNATFKDVTVNGNIFVDADGVTLQNVIVKGSVFIDPGKDGSTTLDGVQATRIVVLSGADHSIHVKNTKSDSLVVSSSSPGTHVVAESGTTLGSTLVQSNATIESQSGANVGVLSAQPRLETQIAVGLQGTFANDVALAGSVKLTAEAGAVVSNVKVTKAASPEAIQLAGQFASVSITDSSPLTVVSGTIAKMVTATASSIVVKQGAVVTNLSSSAGSATLSGGGTVNGNVTTATPTSSTTPVTPTPTPTPTPSGGGGGGGGGNPTSTVAVSAITVTGAATVDNGQTLQLGTTVAPSNATNQTIAWTVATLSGGTATINATGLLTATGVGTVTVTATNAASGVTGTKVITIANPTVTLGAATATGNFGNEANINEMITALWATGDSTVQGIAIKPVFSVTAGVLTVNSDNVTAGLLQWIKTQWGGSSVPVAISFSSGTPAGMTTDANWANGYTIWVDLGSLTTGTVAVDVAMTNRTTTTYIIVIAPVPAAAAVNLGMAGDYAILAESGISTDPASNITGNIGVSPIAATGITGFGLTLAGTYSTSPQITGKAYAPDYASPTPSNLTTAVGNMETAYTDAAGRAADYTELYTGDISGQTLTAGVYKWSTGVLINTNVTLSGGADDVWIFQIAKGITQANGASIILTGGAQAKNIFWQAAETVAIGTGAHFEGIILGKTNISLGSGASINGRLLAQTAVTLIANTVAAPITSQDGDYTYTVTNSQAQITGYTGAGGAVTIPSTLGGAPVTSIGDYAFAYCTGLTSITVAANNLNYASIGGVLYNKAGTILIACPGGLTTISIPQGVTSIGDGAFLGSTGLTTISIPQGVTSIGMQAFAGCIGLTSIRFDSATTTIFDDVDTIPAATKIIGYDPSTAKDYATKYGNTFEVIGTTVSSVVVKTAPTKVTYTDGDTLDLTGLVVTLSKSDASTQDVALADFAVNGISTVKANGAALVTADTAVEITVNGKTASQTITVT